MQLNKRLKCSGLIYAKIVKDLKHFNEASTIEVLRKPSTLGSSLLPHLVRPTLVDKNKEINPKKNPDAGTKLWKT